MTNPTNYPPKVRHLTNKLNTLTTCLVPFFSLSNSPCFLSFFLSFTVILAVHTHITLYRYLSFKSAYCPVLPSVQGIYLSVLSGGQKIVSIIVYQVLLGFCCVLYNTTEEGCEPSSSSEPGRLFSFHPTSQFSI